MCWLLYSVIFLSSCFCMESCFLPTFPSHCLAWWYHHVFMHCPFNIPWEWVLGSYKQSWPTGLSYVYALLNMCTFPVRWYLGICFWREGGISGERVAYGPVFPGGVKVHFICWFLWSSCSALVLTLHMGCAFSLSGGAHRQNSLWDVFHVFDWCTGTVQIDRTGMISDACVHYVNYTLRFPCWFY